MSKRQDFTRRTEIAVFTLIAYGTLQAKHPQYQTVHTVYSGFNGAFRQFFDDEDPVACMQVLASEGFIDMRVAKGGAIFKPTIDLLTEPTDEERSIALRVRKFMKAYLAASQARPGTKPGKRSGIEERAEQLFMSGKSVEALRLLGYEM